MVEGKEEREADIERREDAVAAREAALAERVEAAQVIVEAADERDVAADIRDDAASQREKDLDLAELLAPEDEHGYGGDWPERRNANLDREYAKDDRKASQSDRLALTEGDAQHGTDET